MIHLIVYYNNYHWLNEYPMNRAMLSEHVQPYPAQLWEWGIHNYGRPRKETTEIVRLNLLPKAEAIVTRRGILFKGLRYTCKSAMCEQWFVKASLNGSWRVPIAYDPRKLDTIYQRLEGGRQLEVCELLPASITFNGCNLEEVMAHLAEIDVASSEAKPNQQQAKAALNAHLDDIEAKAKQRTQSVLDGQTQHSSVKGIRRNRSCEREHEKGTKAWDLASQKVSNQHGKLIPLQAASQPSDEDEGYVPAPQQTEMLDEIFGEIWNNDQ